VKVARQGVNVYKFTEIRQYRYEIAHDIVARTLQYWSILLQELRIVTSPRSVVADLTQDRQPLVQLVPRLSAGDVAISEPDHSRIKYHIFHRLLSALSNDVRSSTLWSMKPFGMLLN
jgi:hypothetical protein